MFGISPSEFLLILVVAIVVIPAKSWPDVARIVARAVKFVRELVWKITDAAEEIKEQIELEKPITDLTQKTMDDVMSVFRVPEDKNRRGKYHLPRKTPTKNKA
ncbi:MAG: hypothetical protein FWE17_02380 [Alphaproteobacteria bacterium]|nr:hypothetical protein [Alphaproteobacteria bacterium]MCL2758228.1 hypothetical protein [Alphaproteobacteria bacterium]